MTATEQLLAERYGRGPDNTARNKRRLWVVLAVFITVSVVFIGWAAMGRSRSAVTWYDLGTDNASITDSSISTRIRVAIPAGSSAVCTVRALNQRQIEVGRQEVVISPEGAPNGIRTVTLATSERATAAGVKSCVRR